MIRSMTGFGDASEHVGDVHYAVELRSLNNRYFKAGIRLPEEIAGLEAELEALLRRRLTRGSVTLTVNLRRGGAAAAYRINDDALLAYLNHLEAVHQRFAPQDRAIEIDLAAVLGLPGVLQPSEEAASFLAQARPAVLRLVDQACAKLVAMRRTEGQTIAADVNKQAAVVRQRIEAIAGRAGRVVEEYHQRLRARVDELLQRAELKVGEGDLLREVAIYAERSDVSEELARSRAHLDQVQALLSAPDDEPVGRTLDFVAQEMLREANTIASKSNDAQISRAIVEVKGAIDRIKEQVQNVE